MRGPRRPAPWAVRESAEGVLFDASILVGMVRGSLRHRSLVL
jgi:hypothetical protein